MSILTGKPSPTRQRRIAVVVPTEADQQRAQAEAARAAVARLEAELTAERARSAAVAAEAQALRAAVTEGNARTAALLEQLLSRPAPTREPVDLSPAIAKVEASAIATADAVQRVGARLEAALAAQTAELLATAPAPNELEFFVRRDGGEISSIVAKGKS